MRQWRYKEAGFTLIEVIVTMLIAGILATIAGLGIVQGVKGYVFASENAAMSQKAELAMARISLELRDISEVTVASNSEITYKRVGDSHTIKLVGSEITLNSKALIDEVSDLILSYKKRKIDGNEENWNKDINPIEELVIHIDLILEHTDPDISDITFTTTINPRNTF